MGMPAPIIHDFAERTMRLLPKRSPPRESPSARESSVAHLPSRRSDAEIIALLHGRSAMGGAALYDRYHRLVRGILLRVLGDSRDLDDLVQDAFVTAINTIDRVDDPASLRAWLTSVAAFTARFEIRRRARRRFFLLAANDDLPEMEAVVSSPEVDEAVRGTYRVLYQRPSVDRIAFALRFIHGMELTPVAGAGRGSLTTIKGRVRPTP